MLVAIQGVETKTFLTCLRADNHYQWLDLHEQHSHLPKLPLRTKWSWRKKQQREDFNFNNTARKASTKLQAKAKLSNASSSLLFPLSLPLSLTLALSFSSFFSSFTGASSESAYKKGTKVKQLPIAFGKRICKARQATSTPVLKSV